MSEQKARIPLGTVTGRFPSTKQPLQNIPRFKPEPPTIEDAFPNQPKLIVFDSLSAVVEEMPAKEDRYRELAATMFNTPYANVTVAQRQAAKQRMYEEAYGIKKRHCT